MLTDARPMTEGKITIAIVPMILAAGHTLRGAGHKGLCIEHYAFDRAIFSAAVRLLKSWHSLHSGDYTASTELETDGMRLGELVAATPCSLHDTQGAFRRAMDEFLTNPDMMREVFIGVQSIRQSFNLIIEWLHLWLASHMKFAVSMDPSSMDSLREVWACLGVDIDVIDDLVERFQLRISEGFVVVSEDCIGMPDLVGEVAATLLAVWRITRFSESRWLGAGGCARPLVAGCLSGLADLIQYIMVQPGVSHYYINGWKRIVSAHKAFLVRCALISRVGDAVLGILMADSRVCLVHEDIAEALSEEMQWLQNITASAWQLLAEFSGEEWHILRDDVVRGGHVTIGYLHWRVLGPLKQLPWSLAVGNHGDNLDRLLDGPRPSERLSAQIWMLGKRGHPGIRF
jgi:hypothetical protein